VNLPTVAVTLGDPAGIGPEITVAALTRGPELHEICRSLVVGDRRVVAKAAAVLGVDAGAIEVCDVPMDGFDDLSWGEIQPAAGEAAKRWIEAAVDLCLSGEAAAMATAPINKEALWAAGSTALGHTEMLAELTGVTRPQTMFEVKGVRIFFATRHMALAEAIAAINQADQLRTIEESLQALRVLGVDRPSLAVAALNPHAGEGGNFGRQEIDAIAPAVADAQGKGWPVTGPVPADSVFAQALAGRYDAVIAQFHDQGHIAAKTVDFDGTISVTMGLPIIRTSVDHGTAFDIAGTGTANPATMAAAIRAAARLAPFAVAARSTYG
jgi:4-hydroxythreonine-4-phosphate dehydrogenase